MTQQYESLTLRLLLCPQTSYFAFTNYILVPRFIYKVYVVELSKRVFTENSKFRNANPQFNGVLECLYVGMTSKTPAERFRQHKTGYVNKKGYKISAYIVQKYGAYLRPSLYDPINLNPMTKQEALIMEEKLALQLRRQGICRLVQLNLTTFYSVGFHWKIHRPFFNPAELIAHPASALMAVRTKNTKLADTIFAAEKSK